MNVTLAIRKNTKDMQKYNAIHFHLLLHIYNKGSALNKVSICESLADSCLNVNEHVILREICYQTYKVKH